MPWLLYLRVYVPKRTFYLLRRSGFHLRQWWKLPQHDRFHYLRGRWVMLKYWLAQNLSKSPVVTPPPKTSQPPQLPGYEDYYKALSESRYLQRRARLIQTLYMYWSDVLRANIISMT